MMRANDWTPGGIMLSRFYAGAPRRTLRFASLIIAAVAASSAVAQPYPSKPVRLIIPSSPGSGVDFVSRVVAPPLSTELGQQVVTDNRAGAGGLVGAELAAKAAPNGYTLIMATPSTTINAILHKNMSANLLSEFAPIALATSGQFVLIVNPSVPAKALKD